MILLPIITVRLTRLVYLSTKLYLFVSPVFNKNNRLINLISAGNYAGISAKLTTDISLR